VRVGLVAPPWAAVPPAGYGGTEAVLDYLARGLDALGHDVTVFTVADSEVPVRRRSLFTGPAEPMGLSLPEAAHVLAAYEELGPTVDVIHDHTLLGPLVAGREGMPVRPVLVTHHQPFTRDSRLVLSRVARHAHVVAISADHARRAEEVPVAATIHHGIDLERFRPGRGTGGHLLFVGRMSPDKGLHRAIAIARRVGMPLRIVTKMREPEEHRYYRSCIRPLLRGTEFVPEELDLTERLALLREAYALVNPISWPEPFGLVMVEALASGTPVIAFRAGAAPEIVDHGTTGFLCTDVPGAAAAVVQTGDLDRQACRDAAVRRFSMHRMAGEYAALYRNVLESSVPRQRGAGARPVPRAERVQDTGR
jgi:glycosyltransferase involved in cell wall biosynthesis